ncbi:helix-turn-helix domain-containing protein [Mycobacterium sp. pV006]|uniref:helix-turn-helix domain-containing protein n=1 Tax=Mycobacterium sp. pV006 TaxID=3238983 RepID=UPI00351B4487
MTSDVRGRSPGRPRDSSIDARVLEVTRDLLLEVGWDELSLRLVAGRAGVGRASLSRRWKSKAELVLHAILGDAPDMGPFSGTDLRGWISWVVRGSHELFERPDVQAAVPGLMLALTENPQLRTAVWSTFSGPAVELYLTHVRADTEAQRRRAELDARALLTMAAGAALFSATIAGTAGGSDAARLRARITELLTAAVS